MSKFTIQTPIVHQTAPKEYPILGDDLEQLLEPLKLKQHFIWDSNYWYISRDDWDKVFKDVLSNQLKYTPEKFDCEDFAFSTMVRITEKYALNTCAVAIGQSPMGYHGFNLFLAGNEEERKFFILEPQNGSIWPVENSQGYIPEIVIFS